MGNPNFHPFVLPFLIGTILLFLILIVKYVIWLRRLSETQRKQVSRNIISVKTLKAIWETIREALFHKNIFKTNPMLGYMHFSLAFGWFMLILMGKVEEIAASGKVLTEPWLGIFFKYFNHSHGYPFEKGFLFIMDFLLLMVLSGLLLAIIKRFRSRWLGMKKATKHSWVDRTALTALWLIFPLRLLAESATAGLYDNGGFLTQSIGNAMSTFPLLQMELPLWWLYSIALCIFFVLMPFTRYMHIFTEMLLVFLRKWGVTEEEHKTGYTDFELNACSRCGICLDVCQLNTAARINDVQSVYFIREARRQQQVDSKLVNNCLLCNRCVAACPVGLETTAVRRIYRHKDAFEDKKYYEFIHSETALLEKNYEVLYFAGCMGQLTPGITNAMKKILDEGGVAYHFLDEEKSICCGKPLKQQGFLEQAKTLVEKNTELIHRYDASVLVTSCPICYNAFRNDYNLKIEVLHHTQYIHRLVSEGKIKLNKEEGVTFTYHDPCEISRGHDLYQEPRTLLGMLGSVLPVEQEKENALCCGGSLGNTTLSPEKITAIRNETLHVLTAPSPAILATSCPLCKKTFKRESENQIPVLDIAEIIAQHI